jgi:hypothetical protein
MVCVVGTPFQGSVTGVCQRGADISLYDSAAIAYWCVVGVGVWWGWQGCKL